MIGIDVLYLTKVSGDPNPFVSSGEFQINRADQKTTFFGDFVLILVNMWWILTVVRGSSSAIANLLADLDRNLAEIVERILGEVPAGAMADINPLQAMIMQVIQSKIDSPIAEVSVIEKDASGKFKKSE